MSNKKTLLTDVMSLRLTLDESDSGGKVIARGEFARADKPTANNRVYPLAIWESNIKKLRKSMKERKVFGEMEHPETGRTSLKRVSHLVTNLSINDDGLIIGEAEILDTDEGRNLKALIKAGAAVGVSSRGFGSVVQKEGMDVVQEDFDLMTFDFVSDPAMGTAYPEFESTETVAAESKEVVFKTVVAESVPEFEMKNEVSSDESLPEIDPGVIADEIASNILYMQIAGAVEEEGVSFSQQEISDAVKDLVNSVGLSFSDLVQELVDSEGLVAIAQEASKLVNNNVSEEEIGEEIAHKMLGTGGGGGGEEFEAMLKTIQNQDAGSLAQAQISKVVDALRAQNSEEEDMDESKTESTKEEDIVYETENFYAIIDGKTRSGSDIYKIFQNGPSHATKVATISIDDALPRVKEEIARREEILKKEAAKTEQTAKLEGLVKELSFALFLERNLSNHPNKKEIIASINADEFEDLNQLNKKLSVEFKESKEVRKKVLTERVAAREQNASLLTERDSLLVERDALSKKNTLLQEQVEKLTKEKDYAESVAHTAALTAYMESKISNLPSASKVRQLFQKMKVTSKEQVDALIESNQESSKTFSDIRKVIKKDGLPEGLIEEAISNSKKDSNHSANLSESASMFDESRFKVLAGIN